MPSSLIEDWDNQTSTSESTAATQSQSQRPQRQRQPPTRLTDNELFSDNAITHDGDLVHFALLADAEPLNFEEAVQEPVWKEAIVEELNAIERNQTWELIDLPPNKQPMAVKWVIKLKLNLDGSIAKHKARMVAKGFLQRAGIDYSEVFAPVARIETIRLVVALASAKGWPLFQLDVKSAFLNGPLEEEVFVTQPPGFEIKGKKDKVFN